MSTLNRRQFLRATTATLAATTVVAFSGSKAQARPVLARVLDYSAGVPSAAAVRAAGFAGAVRYVSDRRPDAGWMLGKPVTVAETTAFTAAGLSVASVYQFGRAATADWKKGAAGAEVHARRAITLHVAAGGPTARPIYMAIDDNPTREQYTTLIRPYLQRSGQILSSGGYQLGVYGNYNVIQWCVEDGVGEFFWMHDWGSGGRVHPRADIHQLPGNRQVSVDGIACDVNEVFSRDWGQWQVGPVAVKPAPAAPGASPAPDVVVDPTATGEVTAADLEALRQGAQRLAGLSSQFGGLGSS